LPTDADYSHRDRVAIRRALISVSDKTGLIELARALVTAGVQLVSTGSTAKQIAQAGFAVTEVASVTGFAEALDGRVKTLHPKIHGGLLADLRLADHRDQLAELGIEPFELLVVNLYPFAETVASGAGSEAVIEQIDIGGPAMVRAGAKNHANVAVVTNPDSYAQIIEAVQAGGTTLRQRRELALSAFSHTAAYDTAVSTWFATKLLADSAERAPRVDFERKLEPKFELAANLRYGENSHQQAALYRDASALPGLAQARQLGGKDMSYNNFVDTDAALRAAFDFDEPAVAIIKHANPCGIAVADPNATDAIASAYQRAHATDPVSAFGGVIATNRRVTETMAQAVSEVFTEVIVAPSYEIGALQILAAKKNLRILELVGDYHRPERELRQISGGALLQQTDNFDDFSSRNWQLVSGPAADAETMADLEFAWRACRSVKSNAILLAQSGAAVGIGMGQVNRVDSCRLAVSRAEDRANGSVAASDAFFPFADGLQVLIDAGVRAVVQPGGSVRDEEVIQAANAAGVTMYFTGERHFFH
jgi:phosphoribosylaminoimidazolecarboxamide formyltransferase / IMP cyclohydrolase